jgi:hypothetical protein
MHRLLPTVSIIVIQTVFIMVCMIPMRISHIDAFLSSMFIASLLLITTPLLYLIHPVLDAEGELNWCNAVWFCSIVPLVLYKKQAIIKPIGIIVMPMLILTCGLLIDVHVFFSVNMGLFIVYFAWIFMLSKPTKQVVKRVRTKSI